MPETSRSSPLRAALRNALAWGTAWGVAGFALVLLVTLVRGVPEGGPWWLVPAMAVRFGVVGAVAGAIFAGAIRLAYRGRRLAELHWLRFGLFGGAVTAVAVPTLLQLLNLLSGDGPVPFALLADDAVLCGVLGGAAAAVSLRLAQRADAALPPGDRAALDRP